MKYVYEYITLSKNKHTELSHQAQESPNSLTAFRESTYPSFLNVAPV